MFMTTLQTSLIYRPPPILNLHPPPFRLRHSIFLSCPVSIAASNLPKLSNNKRNSLILRCRRRLFFSAALQSNDTSNPSSDSVIETQLNEVTGKDEDSEIGELKSGLAVEEKKVDGKEEMKGGDLVEKKSGIPVVVFLMGVVARLKIGWEVMVASGLLNWLPFGRKEKRLEWLMAEADANLLDAEKQSALLAELNKHR